MTLPCRASHPLATFTQLEQKDPLEGRPFIVPMPIMMCLPANQVHLSWWMETKVAHPVATSPLAAPLIWIKEAGNQSVQMIRELVSLQSPSALHNSRGIVLSASIKARGIEYQIIQNMIHKLNEWNFSRPNSEQNSYHLDTSTETEMFVGRSGHQTSSDWADAADREVNNVMELRSYSQQHQQQW